MAKRRMPNPALFYAYHYTAKWSTGMKGPLPAKLPAASSPSNSICDIQEKFRPAIWEYSKVISTAQKMIKASTTLQIPIYATTQNASRLGLLCAELLPLPASAFQCDKTAFSMLVPEVRLALASSTSSSSSPSSISPPSSSFPPPESTISSTSPIPPPSPTNPQPHYEIALLGIEAHICVTQTALDLLAAGHRVYVLADGVSSCHEGEVGIALRRLAREGVVVTTSEAWLYECMGDARIGEFRSIAGLVKETKQSTKEALQALCKM